MSAITGELGRQAATQLRRDGRCRQDMPDPSWCARCICGVREPLPDVVGQVSLLDEDVYPAGCGVVTATHPSRCRCRPGCLTGIEAGEPIVRGAGGWALLEHAEDVA
ncbi:MAG: hypothetical protein JO222_01390 [Frankiales bacterium]|nr:hypothetical protein [Frankiales bacterium]